MVLYIYMYAILDKDLDYMPKKLKQHKIVTDRNSGSSDEESTDNDDISGGKLLYSHIYRNKSLDCICKVSKTCFPQNSLFT